MMFADYGELLAPGAGLAQVNRMQRRQANGMFAYSTHASMLPALPGNFGAVNVQETEVGGGGTTPQGTTSTPVLVKSTTLPSTYTSLLKLSTATKQPASVPTSSTPPIAVFPAPAPQQPGPYQTGPVPPQQGPGPMTTAPASYPTQPAPGVDSFTFPPITVPSGTGEKIGTAASGSTSASMSPTTKKALMYGGIAAALLALGGGVFLYSRGRR